MKRTTSHKPQGIAIVGMACRFAGAHDLQAFWRMTLEARDGFGPVPPDRWDHDSFFDANPRATEKSYAPRGAFIEEIDAFPALAMGIAPRRAEVMDPQQRMTLEMAYHALADAGLRSDEVPQQTGVFMGVTATEYRTLLATRILSQMMANGHLGTAPDNLEELTAAVSRLVRVRPFSAPGVLANMVAATVAQHFHLKGPAYTSDAACASSLVSIANAVDSLRSGAIEMAVAGGVYINLTPEHHVAFSRIGAMSPSGNCLPFDERADGFVQGDGCGVVVLKRLEDAQRDGDRIYAIIEGVAINNDGGGHGPMTPVQSGQAECIRAAWQDAQLSGEHLGYIESHGTGTAVGDRTEIAGLMDVFGHRSNDVFIGSAKANVGHTMSAAGVTGLIRAALSIYHAVRPPMANFQSPKPELELEATPFSIPKEVSSWRVDERQAGVSSFGFGGTNVHCVLRNSTAQPQPPDQAELVLMSAPDQASLVRLAAHSADILEHTPGVTVAGFSRAWNRRKPQAARLALVADHVEGLVSRLRRFVDGEIPDGVVFNVVTGDVPKLAFLYPGQGAQRLNMLVDALRRFPIIEARLAEMEMATEGLLEAPLSELIYPASNDNDEARFTERLTQTRNCQPVLLAMGHALNGVLESVGVHPMIVAGHSVGEFTAAVAGGVLHPADGVRFLTERGRAMDSLAGDPGAMAALFTDAQAAAELCTDGAVVANMNHPSQTVISGSTDAVTKTVEAAKALKVKAMALNVSHGFHSPVFKTLDLDGAIDDLALETPSVPVASCIIDGTYEDGETARQIFRDHATAPVRFIDTLEQCAKAGANLYLQVGAGGPLKSFASGVLKGRHSGIVNLASTDDRDGGRSLLLGLGTLWTRGVTMDIDAITGAAEIASAPPALLPTERYWAIKDNVAYRGSLTAGQSRVAAVEAPSSVDIEESPPLSADATIEAKVLAAVARASAYPLTALRTGMSLVDDLGFDSMMLTELVTELRKELPGLGGIPQELFVGSPTIQTLVDYLDDPSQSQEVELQSDEPLKSFTSVWRDTPLPEWQATTDARPQRILFVDATGEGDKALLAGLGFEEATSIFSTPEQAANHGQCDLIIWLCTEGDAPRVAELNGHLETSWDSADALIATVAAQLKAGTRPRILLAREEHMPWAESATAVIQSLAREWDGPVVKSVAFSGDIDAHQRGRLLGRELISPDTSAQVLYADGRRKTMGFEPIPGRQRDPDEPVDGWLRANDVVLITGGAGDVGLPLARRVVSRGATVILLGRRAEAPPKAAAFLAENPDLVRYVSADVTDASSLNSALSKQPAVTVLVHGAGVLADGPIEQVDFETGRACRAVKWMGWLNTLRICRGRLRVAMALGSWAGRMGNANQTHYAAGNALMAAVTSSVQSDTRIVISEFGPWQDSAMAASIPEAVRLAMVAQGVHLVPTDRGVDAILEDLGYGEGLVLRGVTAPANTRVRSRTHCLTLDAQPYLRDHTIAGKAILPMASALDMMVEVAGIPSPVQVRDLSLFQGIEVGAGGIDLVVEAKADHVQIRRKSDGVVCYGAHISPDGGERPSFDALREGNRPELTVEQFYADHTFHGPLLQGIKTIERMNDQSVMGVVGTSIPASLVPGDVRTGWSVDPFALDSALQLCAFAAFVSFQRAGTPVSVDRYRQWDGAYEGPMTCRADIVSHDGDRFVADLTLAKADGSLVVAMEGLTARLVDVTQHDEDEPLEIKEEWINPEAWPGYRDLKMRLDASAAMGIDNPYFDVHEGTARNTSIIDGREVINYSSYNYLGLSGDARLLNDVNAAMAQYGTSVSASRVASGERPFHRDLEEGLAEATGVEATLLFASGHATNVTTIGHLFGPDDLILHDELIHDSCLQGIKLSGAARRGFRHEDYGHLEDQLKELRQHYQKVLILIEGTYSMDGDVPDLPRYIALKKQYGCMMMVDEAHSFGTVGPTGMGSAEHCGVDPRDVDIWMGTLSKSLAAMGGWIGGSKALIEYLRYTTPGFVFAAGLPPSLGQAALSALRLIHKEQWRVTQLQTNSRFFYEALKEHGLDTGPATGISPVIPVITGDSLQALQLSQGLLAQGINAKPIVYPAVADDAARLRFFVTSLHTEEELRFTAECVAETLNQIRGQ